MATDTEIFFRDLSSTAADPRLKRNIKHDPRSLNYLVKAKPLKALQSTDWPVFISPLDQGQLGSCVPNAGTAWLATGAAWPVSQKLKLQLNESFAVEAYHDVTATDDYQGTYPPDDTGSDGLSLAKVWQSRGYIDRYDHAINLEGLLTAMQTQAVITGTTWHEDQFNPDSDGRLRITGQSAGGHEYLLHRVDMTERKIWMRNSWGNDWGLSGDAYYTFDDFEQLCFGDYGDVTVMHAVAATPAPTPPQPTDVEEELKAALARFLPTSSCPKYLRTPATDWLNS